MKKTLLIVMLTLAIVTCSMALISCDGLFGDKECDDHQMGEWYEDTPATCTTDGVRRRDCKNCDYYQTEAIPAAHSYGEWVIDTAATCTTDGARHRSCTVCDHPENETVTALGHDYTVEVSSSESTCGKPGSKLMRCSRCESTENQIIPATEQHNYEGNFCTICGTQKASEGLNLNIHDDNQSAYVYGMGHCTDTDVVIPATYQGLPITEIEQYAFQNNTVIHSVVISDNVKSIGLSAFGGCTNLASVTFGNSLEQIYCSFNDCTSLKEIVIPDSVTSIDSASFARCRSLKSVILGDSVRYIGKGAFESCPNLTTFILGNSVSSINVDAFKYTNYIEFNEYDNGYYLGSEENPYMWLWKTKEDITSCEIHEDTKYLRGGLSTVSEIVIPDGVVSIENYVFSHNTSITTVVIPDSVTYIGQYAFADCENLTTVILGSGIKDIGFRAFDKSNDNLKIYYKGTLEDRNNNLQIANDNPSLIYYSESNPYEINSNDFRSYWHYDVDGETVILWSRKA